MEETQQNPLDRMLAQWKKYISRFDCTVFCGSFLLTLLVHLYMFTHKFINHDDAHGLFDSCRKGLASGRWLLFAISRVTDSFSSAWLSGVVGALFLALGVTVTIKVLRFRRPLPALLAVFTLVSFPVVASTYAYMLTAPQYFFALACSALGVLLIRRDKLPLMLLGSISIALAMGCYQSYFSYAAALTVLSLILDVCEQRWAGRWKDCFVTCAKYVLFLALGILLYFAILKLRLWQTGTQLLDYQGIDQMGKLDLPTLAGRIDAAYRVFAKFYLGRAFPIFHRFFPVLAVLCILSGIAGLAVSFFRRRLYRRPGTVVLLALMVLAYPLASNLVYVMAGAPAVHTVMLYSLVFTLLFPAMVLDRLSVPAHKPSLRRLGTAAAALLLALQFLCGYECAVITNRAYFYMDLTYENSYAFFVKLTGRIESYPGFTTETPVALVGHASMPTPHINTQLTGVLTGESAINTYSRKSVIYHFTGSSYNYVPDEALTSIAQTEAYGAMPCYPNDGSIQMLDGVLVVKFS